jgi:hypothetical protein
MCRSAWVIRAFVKAATICKTAYTSWSCASSITAVLPHSKPNHWYRCTQTCLHALSLTHVHTSMLCAAVHCTARRVRGHTPCALKIFDKAEFWRRVTLGQERADTLTREASIQALLTATVNGEECSAKGGNSSEELSSGSSLPVVKLLSVFETREAFVLEMELMSHANLFHR